MIKFINISRWQLTGVSVESRSHAVIHIHIPGVNTKDRIHVRRTIIDKLRGIGIESKTESVIEKWKAICDKKNRELDEADAMSTRLWKG